MATFDLSSLPEGPYDVRLSLPDGSDSVLPGAFTVRSQLPGELKTQLVLPQALGRHAIATLYIEYENIGHSALEAPILLLESYDPDGSDVPILTLDADRLSTGFWAYGMPEGFSSNVQVLASGIIPGILNSGERVRVPVYYAGLLRPWYFSDTIVELGLTIFDSRNTSQLHWDRETHVLRVGGGGGSLGMPVVTEIEGLRDAARPARTPPKAWDILLLNLADQIGTPGMNNDTWGDYVHRMNENARELDRLGQHVNDLAYLWRYSVLQANGLGPMPVLESAVDIAVATPGPQLQFDRSYRHAISERFRGGFLGRGWTSAWNGFLEVGPDGDVEIRGYDGELHVFQLDTRQLGAYLAQPGDASRLRPDGQGFVLTGLDGTETHYDTNHQLVLVRDRNDHTITVERQNGQIQRLLHSSGAYLDFAWNAADHIQGITGSTGELVTYDYSAAGTSLRSVITRREVADYTYEELPGVAEAALLSIGRDGRIVREFSYDLSGRLASASRAGGQERVAFAYQDGLVRMTDALNRTTVYHYDHLGRLAKWTDPGGATHRIRFDAIGYPVELQDRYGRAEIRLTRSPAGQILEHFDAEGRRTQLAYADTYSQVLQVTDPNGQSKTYRYDARGNLIEVEFPDGSTQRMSYDAQGN